MDVFFTYLAKGLLLPPAGNLLLLLAARGLRRHRRLSQLLVFFAVGSLIVLSTPLGATWVSRGLETLPAFDLADAVTRRIEAIVVPGSGRYTNPPEFAGDTVSNRTLERLRYAARVHRVTGWPIAVVGGSPLDDYAPEGALMAQTLEVDFGGPVKWVETRSRNTAENARNARALLDVNTILLVTQAMDMPRARESFAAVGFAVVPAPIGFVTREAATVFSPFDIIPDANALAISRVALHEWLGLLWYRLRYGH